jgi:hypothetical protein
MTTYFLIDSTFLGSSNAGAILSGSNEDLLITANGKAEGSSGFSGVQINGSNDIADVMGQVYGYVNGITANTGTIMNTVSIGTTGTVAAMSGVGVNLTGGADSVENAGQILASNDGVVLSGNLDSVVNSGTIVGGYIGIDIAGSGSDVVNSGTIDGWTGINFDANVTTGTDNVDNSGTINAAVKGSTIPPEAGFGIVESHGDTLECTNSGHITGRAGIGFDGASGQADTLANQGTIDARTSYGVQEMGAATLSVSNSGVIAGHGTAVLFGAASGNLLDNSGTIQGDVTAVGASEVDNTGHIAGAINFGAGNDTYEGTFGSITKTVSGGAGNDTLIGGAGADNFDSGTGSDTLTGNGGNDFLQSESGVALMTAATATIASSVAPISPPTTRSTAARAPTICCRCKAITARASSSPTSRWSMSSASACATASPTISPPTTPRSPQARACAWARADRHEQPDLQRIGGDRWKIHHPWRRRRRHADRRGGKRHSHRQRGRQQLHRRRRHGPHLRRRTGRPLRL